MKLRSRFVFLIAVLWVIPSLVLWFGAAVMYSAWNQQESQRRFSELEAYVTGVAEKCDVPDFLSDRLVHLYENTLKGMFPQKTTLELVIQDFQRRLPPGFVTLAVFDGSEKMLAWPPAPPQMESLFQLVSKPWTQPLPYDRAMFRDLATLVPSPEVLAKVLKGHPGQVMTISRSPRATWAFYSHSPEIGNQRIGGFLALFHQEKLPPAFILGEWVKTASGPFALGYAQEGSSPVVPEGIPPEECRELLTRYQAEPQTRFELGRHLAVLTRVSENTVLIAVTRKSRSGLGFLLGLGISFAVFSGLLWRKIYQSLILGLPVIKSIKTKLLGFYALSFGLPVLATLIVSHLYLEERRDQMYATHRQNLVKRLETIDTGFDHNTNQVLLTYRAQARQFQTWIQEPEKIIRVLDSLLEQGKLEAFYFVSSEAVMLGEYRFFSSEIRRHLRKPLPERLDWFQTWIERGFIPSDFQIEKITARDNKPDLLFPPVWEKDKQLTTFITQSADLSMSHFNALHGIARPGLPNVSRYITQSIIESEGKNLMTSLKANLGGFISLEGTGEYSRNFIDILPGPDGSAWYFLFLFQDLLTLERPYLTQVFAQLDSRSAETRFFAVSPHTLSPSFPDFRDFRRFEGLIKKLEHSHANSLSLIMPLDEIPHLVIMIRCSFLKRYFLTAATPLSFFANGFAREVRRTLLFLAGLAVIGLALAILLIRRFYVPISFLLQSLEAISRQDFSYRIPVLTTDEFGRLSQAFNEATLRLQEMGLAHSVQKQLLPQTALKTGPFEIVGQNLMTQSVGGDYFDFIPLQQNLHAIIVADVSGHGFSSSLVTAMAKAAFTILCPLYPEQPEVVLNLINREFLAILNRTKMMTGFILILDSSSQKGLWANAGHAYPILVPAAGQSTTLTSPSSPLGIRAKSEYHSSSVDISKHSLVLFSDGLVEAMDEQNRILGYDGFMQRVQEVLQRKTSHPLEDIFQAVRAHSGRRPWLDDATLVLIRRVD